MIKLSADKTIGLKIKSDASTANSQVKSLASQINNLSNNLRKAGYQVKSIKELSDKTGQYSKATIVATNGTTKLTQTIDKMGNTIKKVSMTNLTKQTGKLKTSMSSLFSFGKFYAFWNVTKRVRDGIADMVSNAIDFIETTNKFSVSMGSMTGEGIKFVNTITEKFGLAKDEIMNFQSTYNNIMKGLGGITKETAYGISESLTKMAIDYASLYNISTEDAMTKFQSALVGSVRPIRTDSGYDITETTIGEKAKELGVETPVRNLNQMEKRLLRIIVLMEQMKNTGAMSDFARTIEQPANQLKILQNQLKELGMWLGNVFVTTLGKVLPYINGFVMVLKELAKMLAIFVGYEMDLSAGDPLGGLDESANNANAGLGGAVNKAKQLKKILMGFDVLNVIQTPSDSGGGGGSGASTTIDPKILAALEEYDNLMENVSMKATKIRDKIMEWLGFTKMVNEKTGEITWKLKDGKTNLDKIKDAILMVVGALVGAKLGKVIANLLELTGMKRLGLILSISATIAGIVKLIESMQDETATAGDMFGGLALSVGGVGAAVTIVAKALGVVKFGIAGLWGIIAALGIFIVTMIATRGKEILDGFKKIWKSAKQGFMDHIWTPFVEWLTKVKDSFVTVWNSAKQGFIDNIWTPIKNFFLSIWEWIKKVGNSFATVWQSAKDGWNNKIVTPIKNTINNIKTWISNIGSAFTKVWDSAKKGASSAAKAVVNYFIDKINSMIGKINTLIKSLNKIQIGGIGINIPTIGKLKRLATGGMVNEGEMFIAREAGPELVGSIGNRTTVMNNDQIVESVSRGVAQAVASVMGNNSGNIKLYIDGQEITNVVTQRQNRMANITGMGW